MQRAREITLIVLGLLAISGNALADDSCGSLNSNRKWNRGLQKLVITIQEGNQDSAWEQAKKLAGICSRSPLLNYLTGKIAEKRDDPVNALYYYQKASEYTYVFAVEPEMAQKIWYARYQLENPDRSGEAVSALNERIEELQTEIERLGSVEVRNTVLQSGLSDAYRDTEREALALMWSGTGVGIAGLGLLSAGLGIVLTEGNAPVDFDYSSAQDSVHSSSFQYEVSRSYILGWTLLGVGSALLVTGTVLAGVYGYRYTHRADGVDYSVWISPSGASLRLEF